MTLRQTIQNAPAKSKELLVKLAATSNQALKSRETLFQELSNELNLYVELEEKHLLPLLRKHAGTKTIATEAANGNKQLRAALAKLAAAPKDDDAFLARLAELNKGLQQHVRNERNELLPAVLKALDDEEAGQVAADMEARVEAVEEAKREKKRQEAAAAKREADRVEAIAQAEREVARAEKAAERQVREAGQKMTETLEQGVKTSQQTARDVAASLIDQAQQAASGTREAMTSYSGTVQKAAEDLRAVSASGNIAATGLSQFASAWFDWMGKVANTNSEVTRQLFQARSPSQFADMHREFVTSSTRNMIERNSALLEIAQRTSKQALRPLESQLGK
jgi:hypothetical protein